MAHAAGTCPVFLKAGDFGWHGHVPARAHLAAFRREATGGRVTWERIPLSVDPMDEDGHLIFRDAPAASLWSEALAPMDRLVMEPTAFGSRLKSGEGLPCAADDVFEVSTTGDRYAYVVNCPGLTMAFDAKPDGFLHDPRRHYVQSPAYTYRYQARNQLMFESVTVRTPTGDLLVSESSDQLLHLDVRNFFNLRFFSDDVQAEMLHERYTPLGLLAQLRFFVQVLFFKIDLELKPEAHFFRNGVFVPMVMTIPLDAARHVNFGSGIYYTWKPLPIAHWRFDPKLAPLLDRPVSDRDPVALARMGLNYCQGDRCLFRLQGDADGVPLEMSFALKRNLVERGFFPLAIPDAEAYEKKWGKKISRFEGSRMGFYFDCSRLPKGSHEWEFWLKSGGDRGGAMPDCPMAATIRRVSPQGLHK